MTLELFSTSVPAGLETGRSGFCTVAMTRNMPRPLVEQLESLSAYRPMFMPTDPRAADNPVTVAYLRIPVAGRSYSVLSRICFAGLDYTNRTNRFAHHVVLEPGDARPAAGPAWVAGQPGFLEKTFDGQLRYLGSGRGVPDELAVLPGCRAWKRLTGDAGWAGVLAEAMASPSGRSFFLVYDPGLDILPLLQEAQSLLPVERRWEVTFTTYYTGLPATVGCTIRGVPRGSAEALAVPPGAFLDLGKLSGTAPPGNEWTRSARLGQVVASASRVATAAHPPARVGLPPSPAQLAAAPAAAQATAAVAQPRTPAANAFDFDAEPRLQRDDSPPRGTGKAVVLTILASLVVLVGGAGGFYAIRPDLFHRAGLLADNEDEDEANPTSHDRSTVASARGAQGDRFTPKRPRLSVEPGHPIAGKSAVIRLQIDFPAKAPVFPSDRLRFSVAGKEIPTRQRGDGSFELAFPQPGRHDLQVAFAGDDRFADFTTALGVQVLRGLPAFTVAAKPNKLSRGESVAVTLEGLPEDFAGYQAIRLVDQKGDLAVKMPQGDRGPLVVANLAPGSHAIRAIFPGDQRYGAADSANSAAVLVQRKVVLEFKEPDREQFSRGRLNMAVTVAAADKDDPVPQGKVRLLSKKRLVAEAAVDGKGQAAISQKDLLVEGYELRLRFEPARDDWETVEKALPGHWRVIETVSLGLNLEEKNAKEVRIRFKAPESDDVDFREFPKGVYYLEFRRSARPTTGELLTQFALSDTGKPKLSIRWKPDKQSWGKARVPPRVPASFSVITFLVAEPAEGKEGTIKYVLNNKFPPPGGSEDPFAYWPLAPAFRQVIASLHGAEIAIYSGADEGKKPNKTDGTAVDRKVRVKKGDLPLLRVKLLDRK